MCVKRQVVGESWTLWNGKVIGKYVHASVLRYKTREVQADEEKCWASTHPRSLHVYYEVLLRIVVWWRRQCAAHNNGGC
jgi:hypothetical protein